MIAMSLPPAQKTAQGTLPVALESFSARGGCVERQRVARALHGGGNADDGLRRNGFKSAQLRVADEKKGAGFSVVGNQAMEDGLVAAFVKQDGSRADFFRQVFGLHRANLNRFSVQYGWGHAGSPGFKGDGAVLCEQGKDDFFRS